MAVQPGQPAPPGPGLMVAAYLHARDSVHTRWILILSLFFLAFWVVAGILGSND